MKSRMFWKQMSMGMKLFWRNPAALFWTFLLPVLLLVAIGLIFGQAPGEGPKLVWSHSAELKAGDLALRQALADANLKVELLNTADGEQRWQQGKLAMMLTGDGGHYKIRLNSYLSLQGQQGAALVQQAYGVAQARAKGLPAPRRIEHETLSPGSHQSANYVEFLLPGLLGFNLLMMGIFTVGMVNVNNREKGTYRRLAMTPLPKSVFLGAQVCNRIIIVFVQSAILLLAGMLIFGVHNQGSYVQLAFLVLLGAACFMTIGYTLSSFASTSEGYGGIAQLTFLPMMLLSGVYFSLDSAPAWLQSAVQVLPLTPFLKTLRAVFNDGASLTTHGGGLAIVAAWTTILFGVAVKRFKWT
jgi:ABC-2 type transport system permease protein